MNKVLIIGNGFDLDLGLNTKYSDFVASEKWPLRNMSKIDSPLAYYLNNKATTLSWFDLENLIHYYSSRKTGLLSSTSEHRSINMEECIKRDKVFYATLKQSLEEYIDDQQYKPVRKDSMAAKFLFAISDNGGFNRVFTFNYTDLNMLAERIGLRDKIDFQYVHGSCCNNSAIIGVSDSFELKKGYDYLYKTSSQFYRSSNIRYALQEAEEVIFFGHSLGQQDYHYFEDFFKQQCRPDMVEKDKCKITFFTKDELSRQQLLNQLRAMNEGRINYLYDCNDLQFLKTEDGATAQFEAFLQHLEQTSLKSMIKFL